MLAIGLRQMGTRILGVIGVMVVYGDSPGNAINLVSELYIR